MLGHLKMFLQNSKDVSQKRRAYMIVGPPINDITFSLFKAMQKGSTSPLSNSNEQFCQIKFRHYYIFFLTNCISNPY